MLRAVATTLDRASLGKRDTLVRSVRACEIAESVTSTEQHVAAVTAKRGASLMGGCIWVLLGQKSWRKRRRKTVVQD